MPSRIKRFSKKVAVFGLRPDGTVMIGTITRTAGEALAWVADPREGGAWWRAHGVRFWVGERMGPIGRQGLA